MYGLDRDPEKVLAEVLSRPEFLVSPWWDALDRLKDDVGRLALELLRRLVSGLGEFAPSAEKMQWSVIILGSVIGILLLVGLWFAARRLWELMDAGSHGRAKKKTRASATPYPEKALSAEEWRNLAEEAAQVGKYSEAFVMLFRSRVAALREGGALTYDHARTYRELLNGVHGNSPLKDVATRMAPIFDFIRFGGGSCSKEEYQRFARLTFRCDENGEARVS